MNDEWKYKELPRASGQIAPAQWNPETGEWEVFTGLAKVQDESVEARLQAIEQTQSQILNKLNDTIDTRLTGSIDEYALPVKDSQSVNELEQIRMSQSVIANKISEPPSEELELFKNIVLEPGQLVGTTQILKGFNYFILGHNSVGKHSSETPVDVTVNGRYRTSNNVWLSVPSKIGEFKGHYGITDRIEVVTPQIYLSFVNNTDKPMELNNIFMFKVK